MSPPLFAQLVNRYGPYQAAKHPTPTFVAMLLALADALDEIRQWELSRMSGIQQSNVAAYMPRFVRYGLATRREDPDVGRGGQPAVFYTITPIGLALADELR